MKCIKQYISKPADCKYRKVIPTNTPTIRPYCEMVCAINGEYCLVGESFPKHCPLEDVHE